MPQADPFAAYRVGPPAPQSAPPPSEDPFAQFRVGAPRPAPVAPAPPSDEPSLWDSIVSTVDAAIPTVLRVGGGVVGSIGAGLAALPSGPGALAAAAAGGAFGSAAGSTAAQGYEMWRGRREDWNPTAIAVDTALGAIPVVGKAGSVVKTVASRAGQGAVLGAGGDAATRWAEGQDQDLAGSLTAGALGAVIGGGAGALEARSLARRAATPRVTPDAPTPVVRPDAPTAAPTSEVDDMLRTLGVADDATVQIDDPRTSRVNASGESAASMEALSRQSGMKARGEQFVVYRPDGTRVPLIGPDAVDYRVRPGESYGVEGPDGFRLLDGTPRTDRRAPGGLPPAGQTERRRLPEVDGRGRPVMQPGQSGTTTALDPEGNFSWAIEGRGGRDLTTTVQPTDAPVDDLRVRTPRPTASPEAARLARVANQDGLPPTQPIPESRRVTEQMVARFPEHQRTEMLDILAKNDAFESQRRGVQTGARREALAAHIQMDLSKKLRPGTILNSEETDHLAGVLTGVQDRVQTLASRVAAGSADDWEKFALAQAKMEEVTLMASFYGTSAEQGRALAAHRYMTKVLRTGDLDAVRKAMTHPTLRNVEGFAEEFLKKGSDVEKMDFMRDVLSREMSGVDKALAYFYANVLSGPKTHLRNLFGSGSNIAFRELSNIPAVGFDIARSKLKGQPRTIYAGEITPRAFGAWQGLRKGLSDAAFVMKHGYAEDALQAFDTPRVELGGGAANPFNLPGRLLEAEDQLMYRTVYEANVAGRLYARARQQAAKAGVTGAERDEMVGRFMADAMLDVPKDIADQARKTAEQALFREEPGKLVSWLLDKKNAGTVGKLSSFVIPFVRVPGNIFRQALENNLAGMWFTQQGKAAWAAGGRESAELIGRATAGTAALAVLATWVAQGRVSGGGPSNPTERTALMETGWKPYSVQIPGLGWVDYNLMAQSIALPLSMMANAWETYKDTGDEKALDDVAATTVMSLGSTMLDQSFTAGISDFNSAMTDPGRYAKSWLSRTVQSAVPLSGLMRNVAQTVDPVVRDTSDPSLVVQAGKGIQSILPNQSQKLPARLDRFGRPVERTGGRAAGILPITADQGRQNDRVLNGLQTLNVASIGLPPKTIGREGSRVAPLQTLTPEERARMGQAAYQALDRLFQTSMPSLQAMDPEAAKARVTRVVDEARSRVRAEIQRERRR